MPTLDVGAGHDTVTEDGETASTRTSGALGGPRSGGAIPDATWGFAAASNKPNRPTDAEWRAVCGATARSTDEVAAVCRIAGSHIVGLRLRGEKPARYLEVSRASIEGFET